MLSTSDVQSLINYQDAFGVTPLLVVVANGHETVTQQLIEGRCNVNLQNDHGHSALFFVVKNEDTSITVQLLQVGCDIDVQNITTETSICMSLPEATFLEIETVFLMETETVRQTVPLTSISTSSALLMVNGIRNTMQKVPKNVLWKEEEERSSLPTQQVVVSLCRLTQSH
jgi:hypothetical protein